MKVNFKNSLINNKYSEHYYKLKNNKAEVNTEQNYKITRPEQQISFGSAASLGEKFVQNKALNWTMDKVWANEAAFTAAYSLVLAGIIKPALIINQKKGSEEKDRQIIATKNFLQAFIGFFLNMTVGGGIIKKAVDVIKNDLKLINIKETDGKTILETVAENSENAREIASKLLIQDNTGLTAQFKKAADMAKSQAGIKKISTFFKNAFKKINYSPAQEAIKQKASEVVQDFSANRLQIFNKNIPFVKKIITQAMRPDRRPGSTTTFYEAFESFWKNSTGWITAIMKAKISSLLLPTVMAALFTTSIMNKKSKENKETTLMQSPLLNNKNFKDENEKFKIALNKKASPINFTGKINNTIVKTLAKGVENISMTKFGEGAVTKLAWWKKPSARMADLESILLTIYWLQNTARSKKIDPDQKLGLNIQTALVTAVSSLTAAFLDWSLDEPMKMAEKSFSNVLTRDIAKLTDEIKNGKEVANLQEAIKNACKNLAGSSEIAKKLAKTGLSDSAAVEKEIASLTASYGKKLSKMKSLTIFTLIVRLIVPVIMVPIGGKLKNKIKELQKRSEQNKIDKA